MCGNTKIWSRKALSFQMHTSIHSSRPFSVRACRKNKNKQEQKYFEFYEFHVHFFRRSSLFFFRNHCECWIELCGISERSIWWWWLRTFLSLSNPVFEKLFSILLRILFDFFFIFVVYVSFCMQYYLKHFWLVNIKVHLIHLSFFFLLNACSWIVYINTGTNIHERIIFMEKNSAKYLHKRCTSFFVQICWEFDGGIPTQMNIYTGIWNETKSRPIQATLSTPVNENSFVNTCPTAEKKSSMLEFTYAAYTRNDLIFHPSSRTTIDAPKIVLTSISLLSPERNWCILCIICECQKCVWVLFGMYTRFSCSSPLLGETHINIISTHLLLHAPSS